MKTFTGVVVKTSTPQTAVVQVTDHWLHPKYKKNVKRTKKYQVHDEDSAAKIGDEVIFSECRPISKTKTFTIKEISKNNKKKV